MAADHSILKLWTGLLLAGGGSSRMGESKSRLMVSPTSSRSFFEHSLHLLGSQCGTCLILGGENRHPQVPLLPDAQPQQGPLRAVADALPRVHSDWVLLLPVDMPGLTQGLLQDFQQHALSHNTVSVVLDAEGRRGFPMALPRSSFESLRQAAAMGETSLFRLLERLGVSTWQPAARHSANLMNLNTPAELHAWRSNSACHPAL